VNIYPKRSSKAASTIEIKQPFKKWFDAAGHFVPLPFQQILATNVPAIAKSDAKRSVAVEENASLDSSQIASGASTSGSSVTPSRAAKSRKKA
jgi:signal peptidase complex subunit 2